MPNPYPCPRCKRPLQPSGELSVNGQDSDLPVYQCDECLTVVEFGGELFEAALTFAVDSRGRILDVETFEPMSFDPPLKN